MQSHGLLTDGLFQDEVDPYKKPKGLLQVSPKGLIPGLRFDNIMPPRSLNESTIIIEYLEECAIKSAFAFCLYLGPRAAWPRKPLDGPSSRLPPIPVGYTYSTATIDCPPLFNMHLQMRGLWSGYKLITSIEH